MIKSLIDNKDVEGLKSMSQQQIKNVWHPIRFGAHNDEGGDVTRFTSWDF
jgi:hypothetical protein